MTTFSSLNLAEPIAKAVAAEGYTTPTPIQAQAIPPVLAGKDLLGIAQTGTGKTAAFALPILDRLARNPAPLRPKSPRVLILAPTRELAAQIAASFFAYGRFIKVSVATVFGGTPINRQIRDLHRGVDVLVATPGRLIDLLDRKAVMLNCVEVAVLDEADQMLDLGFIHALRTIMPLMPKGRQTLLFSATMPKAIAALADQYQDRPVRVEVAPVATTAERVEQFATFVRSGDKQGLLTVTLQDKKVSRALIFTRTKHGADKVVRSLEKSGLRAVAIHGNKSQPQREKALEAFRSGRTPFLVATDIAARGLDIDNVSHVINYEIPNVPEQYVHRIGRTARAGATGVALSFVGDDERSYLRDIERLTRQRIPLSPLPTGFEAPAERQERSAPKKPHHRGQGPSQHNRGQKGDVRVKGDGDPRRDQPRGENEHNPNRPKHRPRRRSRGPQGPRAAAA
ncbi:MAG: DEAD/DEAH box helicase [Alphaproteobacteria bacterium RIFCSPHIGHO2_12_FULL_63_12]|nr:MAG: DEAD/DEAH box helicase [Alphaproteobacteria bacterium RIFCSPHIGHO2_12_FULL_63_12]